MHTQFRAHTMNGPQPMRGIYGQHSTMAATEPTIKGTLLMVL